MPQWCTSATRTRWVCAQRPVRPSFSPRAWLGALPTHAPTPTYRGTRAVLRQLGTSEEEAALLLLAYPDLYAQLARTLRELFNAYGRLGIKAFERERQRYVGMVYGRPGVGGAAAAEGGGGAEAGGGGEARLAVGLEQTQFVCDSDVAHRLQRVQVNAGGRCTCMLVRADCMYTVLGGRRREAVVAVNRAVRPRGWSIESGCCVTRSRLPSCACRICLYPSQSAAAAS